MPHAANADLRDKLRDYASEFLALINMGATKDQLRNGASGKHGINHLVETFTMLPDEGMTGEFRIKE